MGVIKILKMVLKYSSGTIIAFQDFFHQHEFGCWWRTHHHLRQTPRSRRHPFFIQSFFTLNTSLGQITLEDYFEMVRNVSQFHNCSIHCCHCRFPVNAETVYTSKLEVPIPTWSAFVRLWEIRRMYRYYEN